MNLLFFDIECAGVYKTAAKICAFGYVLCDGQFNILKKEDILINPLGKFRLTSPRGDGIVLPYDEAEFKKQPTFPKVYRRIKELLEDKDTAVLGHATLNDVRYLNLETRRFRLPSFDFLFSDSQLLFMSIRNDFSHQFGLGHIADELGVEFTPHRAADDAYATMRVVEAMCREKGMDYKELSSFLKIKNGRITGYSVTSPSSEASRIYAAKKQEEKLKKTRAHIEFFKYLNRKRPAKDGSLRGRVFSFSRDIEEDLELSKPLIDKIYAKGGRYVQQLSRADTYVLLPDDSSVRTKNAQSASLTLLELPALWELLND